MPVNHILSVCTITTIGLVCKAFLNLGFCKSVAVTGLDHLVRALDDNERNNGRGIVTVANHISTLDDPVTWGVLPARCYVHLRDMRWALGASDIMFTNPGRILMETQRLPVVIPMWLSGFEDIMSEPRPTSIPAKFLPRLRQSVRITFAPPVDPARLSGIITSATPQAPCEGFHKILDGGLDIGLQYGAEGETSEKHWVRAALTAAVQREVEKVGIIFISGVNGSLSQIIVVLDGDLSELRHLSSLSIAYVTYVNNAGDANVSSPFLHRAGSLYSASLLFAHWASTFLFLTIVLVLQDRQKCVKNPIFPKASVLVPRMCLGWSVLLFIASTVDAGLSVAALTKTGSGSVSVALAGPPDVTVVPQVYEITQYVSVGLWFIGGLLISALSACVYASAWFAGVIDKIINLTVCIVTPLCILGILEDIVFKFVMMPSFALGVSTGDEHLGLVNNILFNVLRSAVFVILITMGLNQWYWQPGDAAH
ncbi:hypothetical protein EW145_g4713 [Phellinidium pouzarii]|uniref:Tafazzin family protein n=1 Tax=Phellinidium pouzarii TaxID=167371 RepID=A0A4S4L4D0_9AGAM|nr:hypothetical protein EW145_g4713 [Phellinidium pouzarii]